MAQNELFQFAEKLMAIRAIVHEKQGKALEKVAIKIKKTAQQEIGHYMRSVGHFPAWARLTDSTLSQKTRLGYAPPDNPLLATGEMRDSIKYEVNKENLSAIIGATDYKMLWHEFGTSKMAMRPVLGPALYRNKEYILKTVGRYTASGIFENQHVPDDIHESLGYNIDSDEQ